MRIQGPPTDAIVLRLWELRGESGATTGVAGVHLKAAKREILNAFAGPEPGKTFAACLIISDGILPQRREAREHLLGRVAADVAVDGLTGLMCLETLQFIPNESLVRPAIRRFLEFYTGWSATVDLASSLLERAGGKGPQRPDVD